MLKYNFWDNTPAQAAQLSKKLHPQSAEETLALADEICENSFTFRGHWEMERTNIPVVFNGEINWRNIENNDPEWMYAFNRHSFLVTLGKAWQYTQNTKYPAAAAKLWQSWIDSEPFAENAKNATWRSIETGLRCESWLRALSLFEGSGMPNAALTENITASLKVHAGWLLEASFKFQQLSNWGVLQDHGLFLLGLAFENKEWQTTAITRLCTQLHHQVMADGTHWEQSPMYHCEVLHCCLDTMLAAKNSGTPLPQEFTQPTHAMAEALAALVRPDGLLICQGDSDEVDARDLLALAAFLFNNPALKRTAGGIMHDENIWDFACRKNEYDSIESTPEPAHQSAALPHSGNYMMQGEAGENAGFLHFACGALGSGHGHSNQLHVDLVHRGESILCDSGRYTYVDTPLRLQLKGAAAHNCVVIDEKDFTPPKDTWGFASIAEPMKGVHLFTPKADYAEGAHLGYFHLGLLHRRRVLRLPQNLWVLWDSVYSANENEHTYSHYYHFGPNGKASVSGTDAEYNGQRCGARLAFAGGDIAKAGFSISRQPISREYNKLEESDCLLMESKAAGFYSAAAVIAAGDSAKDISLSAKTVPVSLADAGTTLPKEKAEGLVINLNGNEYTVIVCHSEVISYVDMLSANGHSGYGKAIVFMPGEEEGTCLAW